MNIKQGQPTKYRSEMCVILEEMMREGASQIEVMAKLKITKETFNNCCKFIDFSVLVL